MSNPELYASLEELVADLESLEADNERHDLLYGQIRNLEKTTRHQQRLYSAQPSNEALVDSLQSQLNLTSRAYFGDTEGVTSMESFSRLDLTDKQAQLEASFEGVFDKLRESFRGMLLNRRAKKIEKLNKKKYDKTIELIEQFVEDTKEKASGVLHSNKVTVELPGDKDTFSSSGNAKISNGVINNDRLSCASVVTTYSNNGLYYIGQAIRLIKQARGNGDWNKAGNEFFSLPTLIEELPKEMFVSGAWMQNVRLKKPEEITGLFEDKYNPSEKRYALIVDQPSLQFTKGESKPIESATFDKGDLNEIIKNLSLYADALKTGKKNIYRLQDDIMFFASLENQVPKNFDGRMLVYGAYAHGRAVDQSQTTVLAHMGRSCRAIVHLADRIIKELKKE